MKWEIQEKINVGISQIQLAFDKVAITCLRLIPLKARNTKTIPILKRPKYFTIERSLSFKIRQLNYWWLYQEKSQKA